LKNVEKAKSGVTRLESEELLHKFGAKREEEFYEKLLQV
jgi:hypothetical protein